MVSVIREGEYLPRRERNISWEVNKYFLRSEEIFVSEGKICATCRVKCGSSRMNLSKFSEMFDKKKTFRPKKKFQPGTMKYSLHKQAQASLNSGINLRQVSKSKERISISKSYIAKLTQGGQTAKRRGFQRLAGCARGRLLQQVRLRLPILSPKV